jgi:hypothetical protein
MTKTWGNQTMYMYEMILAILVKKGSASIPSICQEMNDVYHKDNEKIVQPSQVKTSICRKKDLFKIKNELVFIDPEKDIQKVTVYLGFSSGPSLTIKIDFEKNQFTFFEWQLDPTNDPINKFVPQRAIGDVNTFKNELYRIKPWEWEEDYESDGIVLDGTFWSVKLETKGKVYESEGLQSFPKEWNRLCFGLSKLTGIDIHQQL